MAKEEVLKAQKKQKTPAPIVERKKSKWEPDVPEGINFLTGKPFSDGYYKLLSVRRELPSYACRKQFLKAVKKNQCVVVVGETGSGKTTQCTQYLLEAGLDAGGAVACTQPRRVAAMSVAERVALEMDVPLGTSVGYKIRFDDKTTPLTPSSDGGPPSGTRLRYCTDGVLLSEAQRDPLLQDYSIIVLDEAHERTLDTDILFGLLKDIMPKRPELRVIIMSATLDAERFKTYFDAPLISIPGRTFPVEIHYSESPEKSYLEAAMKKVLDIHSNEAPGDILVFLTGEEEIETAKTQLEWDSQKMAASKGDLMVVPLYSSLPPKLQQRVFLPAPKPRVPGGPVGRKVVLATNVAETSLTIDGIVYVVDPGLSKQKTYNPRTRMESLLVCPISRASADQRAGRAGRTRPGKCYRLYTEDSYKHSLVAQTYPEILRSNLARVVLTLLKLGVTNLVKFDFMEAPAAETMMRALEELHFLGAIGDDGTLTDIGNVMAQYPLDPCLSAMLIYGSSRGVLDELTGIAAMLSAPSPFMRPRNAVREATAAHREFVDESSDHLTLLNVLTAYIETDASQREKWAYDNFLNVRSLQSAEKIYQQLCRFNERLNVRSDPSQVPTTQRQRNIAVRKGILAGYFMHCAIGARGKVFHTLPDNQPVALHPGSTVHPSTDTICYNELVMTTKNFTRTNTVIDPDWLPEVAPKFFSAQVLNSPAWTRR